MKVVNLHEAKTHLSRLVDEAGAGSSIIIAKAGRPVARLVPLEQRGERVLGLLSRRTDLLADLDTPLPDDLIDEFYS